MFGSTMLDAVIGVSFIYLVLSLICASLGELGSRILRLRSRNLQQAVRNLLDQDAHQFKGEFKTLFDHPLIQGLALRGNGLSRLTRGGKPSYIPSHTFALALFDTIAPADDGVPRTLESIRAAVGNLNSPELKRSLLPLIDSAGNDLQTARRRVEDWFDDAMDRASGWYKRKVQLMVLAVALAVTVAMDADTLDMINLLWSDSALRDSVVAAATETISKAESAGELTVEAPDLRIGVTQLQLLDWSERPDTIGGWLTKLVGWLATVMSISLGAPFWFDFLGKLVNLRGSGNRPVARPVTTSPNPGIPGGAIA